MQSRITQLAAWSIVLTLLVAVIHAEAITADEMLAIKQDMETAFNAHDVDGWVAHLTDDAVFDYVPTSPPIEGKAAIAEWMTGLFQSFPDIRWDTQQTFASGNTLVEEYIISATQEGEWMGIPATGNSGQVAHLNVFEFEGDKVKRTVTYLDNLTVLVQLGVMPTPELPDLIPSFTLPDPEPTGLTTTESNLAIEERFSNHDLDAVAKMVHPDAVIRFSALGMVPLDRAQYIAVLEGFIRAYSDIHTEVTRNMDLGNGWTLTELVVAGTHDGPYGNIPATGRPVSVRVAKVSHYDTDGLMTDLAVYYDELATLTQIGAFPPPTPPETIRELARRGFEEIWNQKNLSAIDELIAPDFVQHQPSLVGDLVGTIPFKQFVATYTIGFPDLHFELHDIVVEDNLAAVRWTAHGTHLGPFLGLPPSGRTGPGTTGVTITRFENGKEVEAWAEWDGLGLMGWLGLIPTEHELFQWGERSPITGDPGDPEANKAVVMRYAEEVWNQHSLEPIDELFHPEAIAHDPNVSPMGDLTLTSQITALYFAAFPDLHVTNRLLIAEGDMVVGYWDVMATHQGDFFGIPPTGKPVQWTATNMFRFADGKIAESWWAYDALGILQQIGAVPTGPPEDFSKVFFLSLEPGLNMVSLPLKPISPMNARLFAEQTGATVVIRVDAARQKFVGWTPDAPDDGFPIEGGQGYVINVPKGGVVAFTGAAWANQPPVEMAAPTAAPTAAWAFVVNAQLEQPTWNIRITNRNTGISLPTQASQNRVTGVWADLNRNPVVRAGDLLEAVVSDASGLLGKLTYRIRPEDIGRAYVTLPVTLEAMRPEASRLLPNYPNPFNPETWIPYELAESGEVTVRIYDVQGRLVRTLALGYRPASYYVSPSRAAYWDGRNDRGESISSGVYLVSLETGEFRATRRVLLVK